MTRQCNNCYYFSICNGEFACENHTPFGDEAESLAIEELIESGKVEFRSEWEQYISRCND